MVSVLILFNIYVKYIYDLNFGVVKDMVIILLGVVLFLNLVVVMFECFMFIFYLLMYDVYLNCCCVIFVIIVVWFVFFF